MKTINFRVVKKNSIFKTDRINIDNNDDGNVNNKLVIIERPIDRHIRSYFRILNGLTYD